MSLFTGVWPTFPKLYLGRRSLPTHKHKQAHTLKARKTPALLTFHWKTMSERNDQFYKLAQLVRLDAKNQIQPLGGHLASPISKRTSNSQSTILQLFLTHQGEYTWTCASSFLKTQPTPGRVSRILLYILFPFSEGNSNLEPQGVESHAISKRQQGAEINWMPFF